MPQIEKDNKRPLEIFVKGTAPELEGRVAAKADASIGSNAMVRSRNNHKRSQTMKDMKAKRKTENGREMTERAKRYYFRRGLESRKVRWRLGSAPCST